MAASRHPPEVGDTPGVEALRVDANEDASVAAAVRGAWAVVNAVSLYIERGANTFRSVHVVAAERVAAMARRLGVERILHVSGIGADPHSASPYIRSRGAGEMAVRRAFPSATVVRPAVMFGPGDAFVTTLSAMLRRTPVFPLFGRGETRLQPVHVEDVAEGIVRALQASPTEPAYEFAGPSVYAYADLLTTLAKAVGRRPVFFPVPFPLWYGLGIAAEFLPAPPITRNQIELMQIDTSRRPMLPGSLSWGSRPGRSRKCWPRWCKRSDRLSFSGEEPDATLTEAIGALLSPEFLHFDFARLLIGGEDLSRHILTGIKPHHAPALAFRLGHRRVDLHLRILEGSLPPRILNTIYERIPKSEAIKP